MSCGVGKECRAERTRYARFDGRARARPVVTRAPTPEFRAVSVSCSTPPPVPDGYLLGSERSRPSTDRQREDFLSAPEGDAHIARHRRLPGHVQRRAGQRHHGTELRVVVARLDTESSLHGSTGRRRRDCALHILGYSSRFPPTSSWPRHAKKPRRSPSLRRAPAPPRDRASRVASSCRHLLRGGESLDSSRSDSPRAALFRRRTS